MKRILVADDEQFVCTEVAEFLEEKGFEVECAFSGSEALEKVKEFHPRLVLLDIRMPDMDGVTVLRHIRNLDPSIGVVMITALTDEWTGRQCLEFGAYDYITKPLDLDYLETVVQVGMGIFDEPRKAAGSAT
jgi:DNA-binding response OmpR family regulator